MNRGFSKTLFPNRFRTLLRWICGIALLCALECGLAPRALQAEDAKKKPLLPVKIDIEPVQLPPRSASFYPLRFRLNNLQQEIFSGSLRIVGINSRRTIFQLNTPEFAVTDQPLEFTLNLPPLVSSDGSKFDLEIQLLDASGKSLGSEEFSPLVPRASTRRMIVGLCFPSQRAIDSKSDALLNSLNLLTGLPQLDRSDDKDPYGVEVASTRVDPADLPETSLEFTRYDVLVLVEDAWPALKEKQRSALIEWINSGGSLCLMVPANPPRDGYPFLSRLSGRDLAPPPPTQPASEPVLKEMLSRRFGLGRIVLLPQQVLANLDFTSEDWRSAVGFLWKIRQSLRDRFVKSGKWDGDRLLITGPQSKRFNYDNDYSKINSKPLTVPQLQQFDQLLWQLKPPQMGMIPLPWLLASLGIYVLLIGPLDYFLLGWLRARKWTWVVFPVLTIAFTMGMFAVTNRVMGHNDKLRTVTIIDLADPSLPPRVNQLELRMFSMPQLVHSERRQELQTPIDWQQTVAMIPQTAGNDDRTLDEQAPRYSGRIPSNSDMTQYVRQWAPQFRRGTKFNGELSIPEFPWAQYADPVKYAPARIMADTLLKSEIMNTAKSTFGPNCSVYLFHGGISHCIAGQPVLQTADFEMVQQVPQNRRQVATPVVHNQKSFLDSLCIFPQQGLFLMVSQISPTGGRTLEDLPLLDPDDRSQWLLLIAVQEETDLKIYRRRYGGADTW